MEKKIKFLVQGMNCNSCVNKIESGLEALNVEVSLEAGSVIVTFDSDKSHFKDHKDKLEELGFSVTSMSSLN